MILVQKCTGKIKPKKLLIGLNFQQITARRYKVDLIKVKTKACDLINYKRSTRHFVYRVPKIYLALFN